MPVSVPDYETMTSMGQGQDKEHVGSSVQSQEIPCTVLCPGLMVCATTQPGWRSPPASQGLLMSQGCSLQLMQGIEDLA